MQEQGFILQNYVLLLCNHWTNTTSFDSNIGKYLVKRKDALFQKRIGYLKCIFHWDRFFYLYF